LSRRNDISDRKIIIFDLDGTLTKSKSDIDREMGLLVAELLKLKFVAVTSGCSYHQFETQFVRGLPRGTNLSNLYLFPTNSAAGYYYDDKGGRFVRVYQKSLPLRDAKKILSAFESVFAQIKYESPRRTYGPVFENRGSQLTFSALGQSAPLRYKKKWDPDQKKRLKIRRLLRKQLPEFQISIGGTTSIDVTRKGVDKTLCVWKLKEHLNVNLRDMLFVGDALFAGGNDHIMKSVGIKCVSVSGPEETKALIRRIIQNVSVAPSARVPVAT
jgi:phosphomannomutase